MEAARAGLEPSSLEVIVDSESDDRGILGMDPSVPAGPLGMRILVRMRSEGSKQAEVVGVVRRGIDRCPVTDAVRRAIEVSVEVDA
jgi:uncharacterized OsmC-like protein